MCHTCTVISYLPRMVMASPSSLQDSRASMLSWSTDSATCRTFSRGHRSELKSDVHSHSVAHLTDLFTQILRYSEVVLGYTGAQVYKYSDIQVHRYTGTQVYKYSCTQVHKYTSIQVLRYSCTQVNSYTSTQVLRCTSTQVLWYSDTQVYKDSGTHVLR